ncbi:MAG: TetR/AcrR family transcriptional regulator [Saprospiraceae bacterium]
MFTQQVIEKAEELFLCYGIRSVSMDDIARELGVSKKTLYQHLDNKSDLVKQIIQKKAEEDVRVISQKQTEAANAIAELLSVAGYLIEQLRKLTPTFRYDLEKYYREVHEEIDSQHAAFFLALTEANLKRGIQEGLYRQDLNISITAKVIPIYSQPNRKGSIFSYRGF